MFKDSNFFNENWQIISRCPVCNGKYQPLELKILEEKNEGRLIHIKCHFCQSSVLALILLANSGIISVGIITDLNKDDVLKFKDGQEVSIDEVIETHQFLARNKMAIDKLI